MSDNPMDRLCRWLPAWWSAMLDMTAARSVGVPLHLIDQATAASREIWSALDVDVNDESERHALAVGLAYGARFLRNDYDSCGVLAALREWGPLGETPC